MTREFCQHAILYIYDSVRTCERENHFEAIDGTVLFAPEDGRGAGR